MAGIIYVIGLGPGDAAHITPEARKALKKAGVVVGNRDSLSRVARFLRGKEPLSLDRNPVERARIAAQKALAGEEVAILSPGHPGIYAIASTLFSYLKENNLHISVEVLPGLTLADYAAARLGSPLGADHAVISLADRAGDWRVTKRRLAAAMAADFVLVVYNPRGRLGNSRLKTLLKLTAGYRMPQTPVGLVTDATGANERVIVATLGALDLKDIKNNTLLVIGNKDTFIYRGRMVAPRPYRAGMGY
jgi:precorrin-3B C17-methyltransferase